MDEDLLEKIKSGDAEAFKLITDKALINLKPTAEKHFQGLKKQDFEDALQSALLRVWKKCAQFKGKSSFETWFYVVIRNELFTFLKKRHNILSNEKSISDFAPRLFSNRKESILIDLFDYENNIDEKLEQTGLSIIEKREEIEIYRKLIADVLEHLKPSQSLILKLALEEKKSYKEIASELNLPLGTVMSRIFQARIKAKKLIKEYAERDNIQLSCLGKI